MRIDRWNGGTLRRYHGPRLAVLVVNGRTCSALPPFCNHIAVPVSRATATATLRLWRASKREGH